MSKQSFRPPEPPDVDVLAKRIDALRLQISHSDFTKLADNSGSGRTDAGCEFLFWGQDTVLLHPELRVVNKVSQKELPSFLQAMVLYYFATCDDTPPAGEWMSFSELADGKIYNQAFYGYTGKLIAQKLGLNLDGFCSAAEKIGGHQISLADAGYRFQILPKLQLASVFWLGEDEFPSSCQILFDRNANHFLPTDALAILGSMLTRKLLSAA